MKALYLLVITLFVVARSEGTAAEGQTTTDTTKIPSSNSGTVSLNDYNYKNLGRDWPGLCISGSR
jgi:hypothetical protein